MDHFVPHRDEMFFQMETKGVSVFEDAVRLDVHFRQRLQNRSRVLVAHGPSSHERSHFFDVSDREDSVESLIEELCQQTPQVNMQSTTDGTRQGLARD